jgi:hypothetical protein
MDITPDMLVARPGLLNELMKMPLDDAQKQSLFAAVSHLQAPPIAPVVKAESGKPMFQADIRQLLPQIAHYSAFLEQFGKNNGDWRPELRLWMRTAGGEIRKNFERGRTENGKWAPLEKTQKNPRPWNKRDNPESRNPFTPPLTDFGSIHADHYQREGHRHDLLAERESIRKKLEKIEQEREKHIQEVIDKKNHLSIIRSESTAGIPKNRVEKASRALSIDAIGDREGGKKVVGESGVANGVGDLEIRAKALGYKSVPHYIQSEEWESHSSDIKNTIEKHKKIIRESRAEMGVLNAKANRNKSATPEDRKAYKDHQKAIQNAENAIRTLNLNRGKLSQQRLDAINRRIAEYKRDKVKHDRKQARIDRLQAANVKKRAEKAQAVQERRRRLNLIDRAKLTEEDIRKAKFIPRKANRDKFIKKLDEIKGRATKTRLDLFNAPKEKFKSQDRHRKHYGNHYAGYRGLRDAASNAILGKYGSNENGKSTGPSLAGLKWLSATIGVNTEANGIPYAEYLMEKRPFMVLPQAMGPWFMKLVEMGMLARLQGLKSYAELGAPPTL